MARTMREEIYALDDTRFVTGAMHGGIDLEESAVDSLDVCGINYQTEQYDSFHKKHPDMPVFASESTSSFSVRSCYEDDEETHMISSYDEHAADWGRTVRQTWKDIMARDFMAGAFMWTGFDYLGDSRTVDVHVRRLREKLERVPAEPAYIMTKWGVGYYFQGENQPTA